MYIYFVRRFLLMIPTFVCITLLCFVVTRYVPGGPVEQAIMRYQQAMAQEGEAVSGGGGPGDAQMGQISPEMMQRLKEIYGFDRPVVIAYFSWLWRVVAHQDLGRSDTYDRPVWDLIKERFPISITFGLTGFLLSYIICIPLGVWKAVKHGSPFDTLSSVIVFVAYSIPGWTAGVLLLMMFGGGSYYSIFPLGGIYSSNIRADTYLSGHLQRGGYGIDLPEDVRLEHRIRNDETINSQHPLFDKLPEDVRNTQLKTGHHDDLNWLGRLLDRLWHLALPVFCYVLGMFATKTVLMKNSLMENLGQDYVRTAFAKGLSEKTVIFKHALRNSLIPIATGLGHMLSIILAGSYLIETVFNINGFGLLGYESLIARDYPVVLGILVIGSLLRLFGNIMSDLLYCIIDPRIRFS